MIRVRDTRIVRDWSRIFNVELTSGVAIVDVVGVVQC